MNAASTALARGGLALLLAVAAASAARAQSAPTNVVATAKGSTTVEITWTGAAGATGYHVFRGPGASGPWTRINAARLSATATSYLDTSAPAGSTVCYLVQAVFPAANLNSAAACATMPAAGGGWALTNPGVSATARVGPAAIGTGTPTTPPVSAAPLPAPTGFKAVAVGANQVDLSWNAVPGATGYVILRSHFVAGVAMGTSSADVTPNGCLQATSLRDTGLARGEYRYHIRACPGTAYAETTVQLGPKSGWYRITLNGLFVHRQTVDHADGTNDEVYLAVHVVDHDPGRPTPVLQRTLKTILYQDVQTNEILPPGMICGVRTSATHLDRAPLLVWEGELAEGVNGVLVVPTIWESDNDPAAYSLWTTKMNQYPQDPSFPQWISAPMAIAVPGLGTGQVASCEGDRAVGSYGGCSLYANFTSQHVAVTYAGAERALGASTICAGAPGILSVRYEDKDLLDRNYDGGEYVLYLQIERM